MWQNNFIGDRHIQVLATKGTSFGICRAPENLANLQEKTPPLVGVVEARSLGGSDALCAQHQAHASSIYSVI